MLFYLKRMVFDQISVDVHLTNIIQNNCHFEPLAIGENMLD